MAINIKLPNTEYSCIAHESKWTAGTDSVDKIIQGKSLTEQILALNKSFQKLLTHELVLHGHSSSLSCCQASCRAMTELLLLYRPGGKYINVQDLQ